MPDRRDLPTATDCFWRILLKNSREISVRYKNKCIKSREQGIRLLFELINSLDKSVYPRSKEFDIAGGLFQQYRPIFARYFFPISGRFAAFYGRLHHLRTLVNRQKCQSLFLKSRS